MRLRNCGCAGRIGLTHRRNAGTGDGADRFKFALAGGGCQTLPGRCHRARHSQPRVGQRIARSADARGGLPKSKAEQNECNGLAENHLLKVTGSPG